MAMCRRVCAVSSNLVSTLNFSTTCSVSNKWRLEQGLEADPRQFCALTNRPDYSFLDGRPTILSKNKLKKIKYQQDICKRIVELTNEMDVGLQQYYERLEQQRKEKEAILNSKLKPKGAKLLQKNNNESSKSEL